MGSPKLVRRAPAVLLTREAGRSDGLAAELRREGSIVHEIPLTETVLPRNPAVLSRIAAEADGFAWIVFASVRAVEALVSARRQQKLPPFPAAPRLAAVGQATASAIEALGGRVAFVPRESSARGVARDWPKSRSGVRILLPRAERGRPELARGLRARGLVVREVVAYRTRARPIDREERLRFFAEPSPIVVLLAPSAVAALARALGRNVCRSVEFSLVVPGRTTAQEAKIRFPKCQLVVAKSPTEVAAAVRAEAARRERGLNG